MTVPARTGGRALPDRRRAVVGALALGAVALAATATTWVRATTSSALRSQVALAVPGSDAAAASAAGALVVVAAALAMALGGRWGARVAGVGVVLGGVLVVASAAGVLADPQAPAASAAQRAVGVGTLEGAATTTAAVWVALVAGGIAVVVGLLAVGAAGRWSRGGRRHDRPTGTATAEPAPDRPDATAGPEATGPAGRRVDDQDAWDALSRGEDPT
ncbi:Trp biosynthesis-associated membrane protein [Actinotalea sp. Marseille-Q4924]|uniref:Trp biosynthesis-associated membrane protein n=1 Tax=Actinotalea sp. Marseille-Q4924 TaxID=2866571 RepID=UPI001CE40338|nr:Trp biosynthesis-associated membrane protein [Actinotalea sp. Marseille-Q4924]